MDKIQQLKNFKKLQEIWKKKLKDSGFNDIEKDEQMLKIYTTSRQTRSNRQGRTMEEHIEIQAIKQNYYRMAGHFLYDHTFFDDIEKKIWELHSEGVSIREIVKKLGTKKKTSYKKDKINNIVKALAGKMVERYKGQQDE